MIVMKRVLLLFAALLLLLMADAAMHGMDEKKPMRKLGQGFRDQTASKTAAFSSTTNEPEAEETDVGADNDDDNNNNDDDDENLGYKNYGKGSDTETHRYFSSDKPYRP